MNRRPVLAPLLLASLCLLAVCACTPNPAEKKLETLAAFLEKPDQAQARTLFEPAARYAMIRGSLFGGLPLVALSLPPAALSALEPGMGEAAKAAVGDDTPWKPENLRKAAVSEAGSGAWIAEVDAGKKGKVWLAFIKDKDDALYIGAYTDAASARDAAAGYREWKEKEEKARAEREAGRARAKAEQEARAAREKAEREEYERLRPEREGCIALVRSRWLRRVSLGDPEVEMIEEPFALKAEIKFPMKNAGDDPISNLRFRLIISNERGDVVFDESYREPGTFEPGKTYLRAVTLADRYGVLAAKEVASGTYTLRVASESLSVNGEPAPSPRQVERDLKHDGAGWAYKDSPIRAEELKAAMEAMQGTDAPKEAAATFRGLGPDEERNTRKAEELRQKEVLRSMKEAARKRAEAVLGQIGLGVEPVDPKNGRFTFKLTAHNSLNRTAELDAFQFTITRDDMIIKEFRASVFMRLQPGKNGTMRFAYNDRDAGTLYADLLSGKAKVNVTLLTMRLDGTYVSVEDNRLLPNNLAY